MASVWMRLVLLLVAVGAAVAIPYPRSFNLNTDVVYFPDQVEYIRVAHGKCPSRDELFWARDGRCYREGAQGPCGFDFRLVWDERQMRPRCERDNSLFGRRR